MDPIHQAVIERRRAEANATKHNRAFSFNSNLSRSPRASIDSYDEIKPRSKLRKLSAQLLNFIR
jgi:hypothetical protein